MKLWIDDVRPAPKGWYHVETSQAALKLLETFWGRVSQISFDHDLGGDDTTRPVALFLEELSFHEGGPYLIFTHIHSANPVGRRWLEASLRRSTVLYRDL